MDLVTLGLAKKYTRQKILEASLGGGEEVDLSGYAKKTELPTKVSQLTNDSGFISKVPDDYATKVWVKDYVTENSGQNAEIDTTLTQSGKAADAKAVGDALDKLEEKIPSIEGLAKTEDIPDVPSWAMQASKPTYTASEVGALPNTYTPPNQTAEQVGADAKGTAAAAVSAHNTNNAAHNDIRLLIDAITIPTKLSQLTNDKGYITGYTETDPTVPAWAKNATKPSYSKSEVGLGNVDNVRQYSASNPPPYPVTKVNGKTGDVTVDVPTKVSQLQNDAKYLTAVTAAMITAALGYIPIDPGLATLARHTDGLLYLFVGGKPVGSGVELPTGGIDGYVDADKNIVVRGLDEGVTYKFYFELADGSLVEGGELVYDNTVYYTVTNTLTNCTTNNSATQVIEGESYAATITAKSGYELKTVTVTMGGSPVTVSGGNISIANVTDNIVITAVAEEKVVEPTYTNILTSGKYTIQLNKRWSNSSKAYSTCNGMISLTIPKADVFGKTIWFKGFPANTSAGSNNPIWMILDDSNNKQNGPASSDSTGNIWKVTNLQAHGNEVYSTAVDGTTYTGFNAAGTKLIINMAVNTGTAISAIPANAIMTINEEITD